MNPMELCERIAALKSALPSHVTLVAVTKTHPVATCAETVGCGQWDLGENRVQELVEKAEVLGPEVRWHQIGHLQTNKVKYIAPFVHLIHAVDSGRLLEEIDRQAAKNGRVQDVLLQVHIAAEEQKFGWAPDALPAALDAGLAERFSHVRVRGLMGMATFTEDWGQVAREFSGLRKLYEAGSGMWDTLSMGMSGDWQVAVDAGSTMIRVGSSLYGARG
jgi:PLP dependent protein